MFTCSKCGGSFPVQRNGGTGYAVYDGAKVCYNCVARIEHDRMMETGTAILYMTHTANNSRRPVLTNWPGTLKIRAVGYSTGHNWPGVHQFFAWFNDETGATWIARMVSGGWTQLARARRLKHADRSLPYNPEPFEPYDYPPT